MKTSNVAVRAQLDAVALGCKAAKHRIVTAGWSESNGVHAIKTDPVRCSIWHLHDRLLEFVTAETCADEIDSVRMNGQIQPVIGREIKDSRYKYEIISGVRRRFVAEHLNISLELVVRELTDEQALLTLDAENRVRRDVSAFERGRAFQKWIDAGIFSSQRALARAVGLPKSKVSRLIQISKLPLRVVRAFGHPSLIKEYWATEILSVLRSHTANKIRLLSSADRISEEKRRPAALVFRELVRPSRISPIATKQQHYLAWQPRATQWPSQLFTVRYTSSTVDIVIPARHVRNQGIMEALEKAIGNVLRSYI